MIEQIVVRDRKGIHFNCVIHLQIEMHTKSSSRIETIQKYLNINGQPAPYFMYKYNRFNLFPKRVFIGKGSPDEILAALQNYPDEAYRIGIDCSGFVCRVLSTTQPITSIIRHPSSNPLTQLRFFLRPIEKTSVRVLIDPVNAIAISDVNQIRPWDLIHISDTHVMLVYHRLNNAIHYAHASRTRRKVVTDKILIVNPNEPIENQEWTDSVSKTSFRDNKGSGVVRLCRENQA